MMKKTLCLILAFVLALLSVPVTIAETRSGPKTYSASNVSHRFNTGRVSNTIYTHAVEFSDVIIYINSNNPSQSHTSYHCVKFMNQDGDHIGGGYRNVYQDGHCSVSFNSASVTSLYLTIKNKYYGTTESYYKMTTSGSFHLSAG
jgi:hypothetical protein